MPIVLLFISRLIILQGIPGASGVPGMPGPKGHKVDIFVILLNFYYYLQL